MTLNYKKPCTRLLPVALLTATALSAPQAAYAGDSLQGALENGKLILDLRLRNETVSQDGFDNDANGLTLRTRLGFETGDFYGFKFLAEFENTANVDDEDYDNKVNGNTAYPVIADPDNTQFNRAQFTYTGTEGFAVIGGRQRINLGNQRFLGAVGFRQNEQTYDAIVVQNTMIPNTTLTYGYIDRVHSVVGGKLDTSAHAVNVDYKLVLVGTITAYAYLLDIEDAVDASTATYGARVSGKQEFDGVTVSWDGEYAVQSDYADSTLDVDTSFYSANVGVALGGYSGKIGYDVLGGRDGGDASFQTPLATLHKWQGFADMFLSTPEAGVKDMHASVSWSKEDLGFAKNLKLAAWYHDFEGDDSGIDMGSEIDLLAAVGLGNGWGASVKYADYTGEGFKPDTKKVWVTLSYKY